MSWVTPSWKTNKLPDADYYFQLTQSRLGENVPRVKIIQQLEQFSILFRKDILTIMFCRVLIKSNHLLGTDSMHACMAMEQLTEPQCWEEPLYSSKEAIRIINEHKEWAVASIPKDSPVISTHGV